MYIRVCACIVSVGSVGGSTPQWGTGGGLGHTCPGLQGSLSLPGRKGSQALAEHLRVFSILRPDSICGE
ncbi:hypothetical protein E2C01_030817 [Portunus trituberculatus]|uniref:Uncharacterized protein n=1 Tax=Portunus trituberculatus TaxID=210409 RepID=A0A5B7ESV7_PORTR|nr:hypothetical protein [Portunus trituberculatus]